MRVRLCPVQGSAAQRPLLGHGADTDGEGGCVHVHATIANHDLESGTAIAHGTDHATVKRKNDRLSREMGFTVAGPNPPGRRPTWAERKGQFGIESFERVLGNRVADARDHASNMEEFLEELKRSRRRANRVPARSTRRPVRRPWAGATSPATPTARAGAREGAAPPTSPTT